MEGKYKMKVAIVHYWFITRRGGEKVVESILKLFPKADIYTLFYDKEKYGNHIEGHKVYTSKYDNTFFRKYYQKIFPLYPKAIQTLKLKEDYDLIISSESGPAKGIQITNNAKHICYIHSPMRYCWGYTNDYLITLNPVIRPLVKHLFKKLKEWDKKTIDNVDLFIANSENVKKRVQRFYNRDAIVIYPPITFKEIDDALHVKKEREYFLSFGALTPYKRIDLLVDYFNDSKEKLIVIGNGSEKEKLQKKAKSNIEFKGFVGDKKIKEYILNAKALLFPGEEDFGMIPLEVMSLGIPVIAFKKGGALETVVEDRKNISKSTGIFFKEQNKKSLDEAISFFKNHYQLFSEQFIKTHAKKFEEKVFLHRFKKIIKQEIEVEK